MYILELNVDTDGAVLLCCSDFQRNCIIANMNSDDAGTIRRKLRKVQLVSEHNKLPDICKRCDQVNKTKMQLLSEQLLFVQYKNNKIDYVKTIRRHIHRIINNYVSYKKKERNGLLYYDN